MYFLWNNSVGVIMYKKIRLKNGLRLILIPRKETAVFTAMVLFGVGSRHETDKIAGMSHFLEHMAYKGSKKRPTVKEVAEYVDSLGGEHNAFTGREYTGYYLKAASKHLMAALDFLSENISQALIPANELEKERQVILEELKMYEDIPQAVASELYEQTAFGKNSLGAKIGGNLESVKAITREQMLAYKASHYSYANAVIAIAGNFSAYGEEKIVDEILKTFKLEEKELLAGPSVIIPQGTRVEVKMKKTEQSNFEVGFIGPSLQSLDWPAARVLAKILGGSMSSRMFMEVREKRGLAYHVETDINFLSDTGLFGTFAGVDNNKVEQALTAIVEQYILICQKEVDKEELERAKEMLCGKLLIETEDSEELASGYALDELILGKIETVEETIAKYRAVTAKDVQNCAKKYFKMDQIIFAGVGPRLKKSEIFLRISNF